MIDEKRFEVIEGTKRDIQKMGFNVEIQKGEYIRFYSDRFEVVFNKYPGYEVRFREQVEEMNQEEFEDYYGEIDNLNRAILWVNTQLKELVLN